MVDLDWDDIQGNVLRGYGFDHAHHVVLGVVDAAAARRLLRRLVSAITPCSQWFTRPESTLNVAFTYRGLLALGLDAAALASFPPDFREGMAARAVEHLGDVERDHPEHWEPQGLHHPSAHVLFMVGSDSAEHCDQRRSALVADALDQGFELVAVQSAAHLLAASSVPGSWKQVEHFGFADGISQPAVEGAQGRTTVEGHGTPLADGTWRPVRPGEFVLGYPDEEEESPPLPEPEQFTRNGSFLVYRKLAQDVAGFRRVVQERAERHGLGAEEVGAKMVGRHVDGAPLGVSVVPGLDGEAAAGDGAGDDDPHGDRERTWDNDFRFGDDPEGRVCPLGSHVRRANPRDGFEGLDPAMVSRHRLLRRGMPYGPALAEGVLDDDGQERGLLFLAYCASISRQFEFVQREWLNDGNVFGVSHTTDPISGHGVGTRALAFEPTAAAAPVSGPGSGPGAEVEAAASPVVLSGLPQLVTVRGGEYLFQPGLGGLRYLSEEDWS